MARLAARGTARAGEELPAALPCACGGHPAPNRPGAAATPAAGLTGGCMADAGETVFPLSGLSGLPGAPGLGSLEELGDGVEAKARLTDWRVDANRSREASYCSADGGGLRVRPPPPTPPPPPPTVGAHQLRCCVALHGLGQKGPALAVRLHCAHICAHNCVHNCTGGAAAYSCTVHTTVQVEPQLGQASGPVITLIINDP